MRPTDVKLVLLDLSSLTPSSASLARLDAEPVLLQEPNAPMLINMTMFALLDTSLMPRTIASAVPLDVLDAGRLPAVSSALLDSIWTRIFVFLALMDALIAMEMVDASIPLKK